MSDGFDFSTQLSELTAERDALLAELPEADLAYKGAFHAVEIAQAVWNGVVSRVTKASEATGRILSPALGKLLENERTKYDAAGLTLTRARHRLEQLRWDISCRNADIQQLDALANPTPPPIRRDIVVKRERLQVDVGDVIVFDRGRAA